MITITSDIALSFKQLTIKFQSILDDHKEEIEAMTRKAVAEFDFEAVLKAHIQNKIEEGLSKAFESIDLSERFQTMIWKEIDEKLQAAEEK